MNQQLKEEIRQFLEQERTEDGFTEEFERHVVLTLVRAATPRQGTSPEISATEMLLCLRDWFSPRIERLAVLLTAARLGRNTGEPLTNIARALASNHSVSCPGQEECSLHSLGALWTGKRLNLSSADRKWFLPALSALVTQHPLRGWALLLPTQIADEVQNGIVTHEDAAEILLAAADLNLLEHLANSTLLGEKWEGLIATAPESSQERLLQFGNRAIAAGCTHLVSPQLWFLKTTRNF